MEGKNRQGGAKRGTTIGYDHKAHFDYREAQPVLKPGGSDVPSKLSGVCIQRKVPSKNSHKNPCKKLPSLQIIFAIIFVLEFYNPSNNLCRAVFCCGPALARAANKFTSPHTVTPSAPYSFRHSMAAVHQRIFKVSKPKLFPFRHLHFAATSL